MVMMIKERSIEIVNFCQGGVFVLECGHIGDIMKMLNIIRRFRVTKGLLPFAGALP